MEKVLIVQPHSDDAILSCSRFLLKDDFNVKVLTVEKNNKRLIEDDALFNFIGVHHFNLGVEILDDYYSEFFKTYGRNVVLSDINVISFYNEKLGEDKIKEVQKALKNKVLKYKNKGYIILCPLGVGHPFHYLIRYMLREIEEDFFFYREFPHSFKKKAKIQLDYEKSNMNLVYNFNDKEVNALKYEIAQKFYKTQSGFFFYEHNNVLKLYPEEFYLQKKENFKNKNRHIKIFVISKDRPLGKTFDFLKRGNVPYTVVVEPQDVDKYKNAGHDSILVLPENDRGFSYTVNFSKNQYDGKNPLVIMDDDIMNFFYSIEGQKKITLSLKDGGDIHEFFDKLNEQILNTNFDIGTIGKSAFDWGYEDVSPRIAYEGSKYRYSGLPVVIIINNEKLLKFDFDTNLCFKSDIDYALKCMYLNFHYAKFVYFLQQTKMNKEGKQKGGLSDTYKEIDKIKEAQNLLLSRWPDNVKIDINKKPNNGVPELKIIYKKSKTIPSIISELKI